ncbi:MAG: hypothetical protein WCS77_06200 [Elusimicrobiaceae bacterium]
MAQGFFARLFEKLDAFLKAKAEQKGCCCGQKNDKDGCCGRDDRAKPE